MKTKAIILAVIMIILSAVAGITANLFANAAAADKPFNAVKWVSYKEGKTLLYESEKKGFIYFYADWCKYCLKMDKEIFSDKKVISHINENFIPIRVNTDEEKKIASSYGALGLPYSCFVNQKAEKISCIPGYMQKKYFMGILKYVNTDSYKKMSFSKFSKKNL
jgi:thioredoxin-related protein